MSRRSANRRGPSQGRPKHQDTPAPPAPPKPSLEGLPPIDEIAAAVAMQCTLKLDDAVLNATRRKGLGASQSELSSRTSEDCDTATGLPFADLVRDKSGRRSGVARMEQISRTSAGRTRSHGSS